MTDEIKFKIGSRVIEPQTCDWGVVVDDSVIDHPNRVWVSWHSGRDAGFRKHIKRYDLELVSQGITMQTHRIENALQALTEAGFRVTLSKLDLPEEGQQA